MHGCLHVVHHPVATAVDEVTFRKDTRNNVGIGLVGKRKAFSERYNII